MFGSMRSHLVSQLEEIRRAGLEKQERVLMGPQGSRVTVLDRDVLNLCANNYLGLADHPAVVTAAKEALDRWGYGMASVRVICGTQEVHKELESALTDFWATGNRTSTHPASTQTAASSRPCSTSTTRSSPTP